MDTTIIATQLAAPQANPNHHDVLLGGTVVGAVRRREIHWPMQRVHSTWYEGMLGDTKLDGNHDRREDAYYAVVQAARAAQGLAPDPYVTAVQAAQAQLVLARENAKLARMGAKAADRNRRRAGAAQYAKDHYARMATRERECDAAVDALKLELAAAKKALRAAHKAA